MKINTTEFLERIDLLIKAKCEQKKEFFKRIGVAPQSFYDWKSRGTIPSAEIVYNIAKNLGVSMEFLLVGDGKLPDDITIAAAYLAGIDKEHRTPLIQAIKAVFDYYNPTKNDSIPEDRNR